MTNRLEPPLARRRFFMHPLFSRPPCHGSMPQGTRYKPRSAASCQPYSPSQPGTRVHFQAGYTFKPGRNETGAALAPHPGALPVGNERSAATAARLAESLPTDQERAATDIVIPQPRSGLHSIKTLSGGPSAFTPTTIKTTAKFRQFSRNDMWRSITGASG